ncbi:MAG: thioredoxin domain-containing protein [Acidobacteria bacterium]|nr:thioredoxin domain-containing protein [Acidobacteriota bacterium]
MKNLRFRIDKFRLRIFLLPLLLIGGGELLLLASNTGLQKETTAGQKNKRPNRLIKEKSPYLLQHAYNPVDWFPWGDEAFTKARSENKLIFLSIGYSTCFWCHQMERDVFEKEEMAELMNRYFVNIKVDREERPDVDRVYMSALLAMTGNGGWPMSMFLTPELKPFYGATYIPLDQFRSFIDKIHEVWKTNPENILEPSLKITEAIKLEATTEGERIKLERSILTRAFDQIRQTYDKQYAGFGSGPKFPRPVRFNFLLRYNARFGEQEALRMTLETLRKMAESGMYDHLGGGFHRYSVDGQWRVPHFEKMLYDQAQLVRSYLEAYQITRDEFYATIARQTLDYLTRDMSGKEGGFYSAEDAESVVDLQQPEKKREGAFYLWTQDEIERALGKEDAKIFNYAYGVQPDGNAFEDPHGVFAGKNILYLAHPITDTAKVFKKSPEDVTKLLADSRSRLLAARSKRPRPILDDKVLASWNGLVISAFAHAAQVLGDPGYLESAQRSAGYILAKLYDPQTKRLLRRYRAGEARHDANLDDYAFLTAGLLDLYEAALDVRWLKMAVELTEQQNALFYDEKQGGFFDATGKDATLLFRTKENYDGAEPSGNSIATLNLLRLAQMTGDQKPSELADRTLAMFSGRLNELPQEMPQMLAALDFHFDKPKQIIIAGQRGKEDTEKMLREAHARFIPNKIILLADGGAGQEFLSRHLPFIQSVKMRGGKATAYICENYTCKLPTTDLGVMAKQLDGRK